jgi:hypothetical protein
MAAMRNLIPLAAIWLFARELQNSKTTIKAGFTIQLRYRRIPLFIACSLKRFALKPHPQQPGITLLYRAVVVRLAHCAIELGDINPALTCAGVGFVGVAQLNDRQLSALIISSTAVFGLPISSANFST